MEVKIYENATLNKIIYYLFLIAIFLIPYDALPVLPSLYKPISLFPLVAIFIILIPKIFMIDLHGKKNLFYFYGFYIISVVEGVLIASSKHSMSLFFDFFVTLSIALVLITTLYILLTESNFENKIEWFAKKIAIAYYFPVIVALLDFLSVYRVLPGGISETIHSIFGGQQHARVNGVTFEASWLSMHLFFSSFSYFYLIKNNIYRIRNLVFLIIEVIIFCLLFSMQGYMIAIIFGAFLWLRWILKDITFKKLIIPISLLSIIIIGLAVIKNIKTDIYFIARLQNLSLDYLLHSDASGYIRILNPTMGLLMGVHHPLGIGGGNYAIYYEEYVMKYFPWGVDFFGGNNEIVDYINNVSAGAKCLYAELIAENGIFSILYFIFLYKCICIKKNEYFGIWTIATCLLMLQFETVFYIPYIFMIIISLSINEEKINETNSEFEINDQQSNEGGTI